MKKLRKVFALGVLAICAATSLCLSACSSSWFGDNLGGGGSYSDDPVTEVSDTNASAIEMIAAGVSYDEDTTTSSVPSEATEISSTNIEDFYDSSDDVYKFSTEGAIYSFSGSITLTKSIRITKSCTIYLNGAKITYSSSSEEDLFKTKKNIDITFVVVDGTTNTIDTTGSSEKAINLRGDKTTDTYSCTLRIIGMGSLTIKSVDDCIKSRGNLIVQDATLNLTSTSGCALKGTQIVLKDCTITTNTTSKDAVHAEIDTYDELSTGSAVPTFSSVSQLYEFGYVIVDNVNLNITTTGSKGDGIQADSFVYVCSGTINIDIADDAKGIKVGLDYTFEDDASTTADESAESYDLDCDYYAIYISGGTFSIDAEDDAIHSEAEIYITGGTFTIDSGDDAIHANNLIQISGDDTKIEITDCYEGIEAAKIEICGGTIDLSSSDDGINAADGTTTRVGISNSNCYIYITGGTITVSALGDGVDSNGDIFIYGGTLYVHGPSGSADAAIDADGSILVYGGEIFAVGPRQMVETPSTSSTQCVISYASNSSISKGKTLKLTDTSGNTIISITTQRSCDSLIISSSKLEQGKTYYLYSGTTLLKSITLSSIVTAIDSSGNDKSGSLPGSMGR